MKVICLTGKAQSGKDTIAAMTRDALVGDGKKVLITHYADLLKYICYTFLDWDGKKDEAGRTLLQQTGTELIRAYKPDYWVEFMADILTWFGERWDYVLIPDCRFPNEAEYLKNRGFDVTLVRVVRPDLETSLNDTQQAHSSETALDNYSADITVTNHTGLPIYLCVNQMLAAVGSNLQLKGVDLK